MMPAFVPADCVHPPWECVSVLAATLDKDLKNSYHASPIDFSSGKSAAVGVINSADWAIFDTDPNQINGPGSAFYDADMRDIEQPYDDAFVEFIAPRSGMGAVPYLPQAWFDAASADMRSLFSKLWFAHWTNDPSNATHCMENNYFHLIGASKTINGLGLTSSSSNTSYVFVQGIADNINSGPGFIAYCQEVSVHELTHQWDVNWCFCDLHDTNNAWCATASNCGTSGLPYTEACLMNMAAATPPAGDPAQLIDGINRLCTTDLLLGSSGCSNLSCPDGSTRNAVPGYGAVRTMPDPW
jgi:hypothetical protein